MHTNAVDESTREKKRDVESLRHDLHELRQIPAGLQNILRPPTNLQPELGPSLGLLAGLSKMFAESSVFFDISFCLQLLTSTFLPVCGPHLKDDLIDAFSS